MFMSWATKRILEFTEEKSKAKALQHIKVNLVFKIDATFHSNLDSFTLLMIFITRIVVFFARSFSK